jgi:hypothetical protein
MSEIRPEIQEWIAAIYANKHFIEIQIHPTWRENEPVWRCVYFAPNGKDDAHVHMRGTGLQWTVTLYSPRCKHCGEHSMLHLERDEDDALEKAMRHWTPEEIASREVRQRKQEHAQNILESCKLKMP